MRIPSAALALAATTALLAGCAAGQPAEPSGPEPEPGATSTADGPGDPAPAGPSPHLDLTCADLLDTADLDAAYGPGVAPTTLTFEGSGGYYPLSQHGLAQAGALQCEYSDRGEPERYALIAVLPDAADAWAAFLPDIELFQPQHPGHGDDARETCRDGGYTSCRVDVLVGDRWVSAVLGGLRTTDAAGPLVASLVTAIDAAAAVDPGWTAARTAATTCDEIVDVDEVSQAVGVGLQPMERFGAPTQPVVYHAGFLAAGGLLCDWSNDFTAASAMTVDVAVLPGGAWAWDGYWSAPTTERITRSPVPGLGDDAWAGCTGDQVCWVSVRVGDHWLDVAVNDESSADETAVAIGIAETIVPRL